MRLLNSFIISLAMYSKIPMPKVEWDEKNMRYVMCFFPLVGLFVALLQWFWIGLYELLEFSNLLLGVGMASIPLAVTGGIHVDGFLDTCDALSSHQSKERKLEILKDSHTGAFAIICFGVYFAFYIALAANINYSAKTVVLLACAYVLERCLSGFSVATFPCAKNSGLVYAFADAAAKKTVRLSLSVSAGVLVVAMAFLEPASIFLVGIAALVFLYYFVMSKREFGGITGDLAGYFLQICEIMVLVGLLLLQKMGVLA